jgi:hypothetical protein
MARTNFQYEKRQRELEKKRKAEEKARRKAEAKNHRPPEQESGSEVVEAPLMPAGEPQADSL